MNNKIMRMMLPLAMAMAATNGNSYYNDNRSEISVEDIIEDRRNKGIKHTYLNLLSHIKGRKSYQGRNVKKKDNVWQIESYQQKESVSNSLNM